MAGFLLFLSLIFVSLAADRPPIVFVPGILGSQIEWRRVKDSSFLHSDCHLIQQNNYQVAWVALNMAAIHRNCFLKTAETTCSATQRDKLGYPVCKQQFEGHLQYRNPEYGTLQAVRYLKKMPQSIPMFVYMEAFLKVHGWKGDGKDIFAAPYDWRFAPTGYSKANNNYDDAQYRGTDFDRLKLMIERAYNINKRKVIIMGHSMGGLVVHEFLLEMTEEWIKKYVEFTFLAAPANAGSFDAIGAAFGTMSLGPISGTYLESIFYTWPTAAYLSPTKGTFDSSRVLATYNGRSYDMNTIGDLYKLINGEQAAKQYNLFRARSSERVLTPPKKGANYYVLIGKGLNTDGAVAVDKIIGPHNVTARRAEKMTGDGTLPYENLRNLVNHWQKLTNSTDTSGNVQAEAMNRVSHTGVFIDQNVVNTYTGPTFLRVMKKYTGIDVQADVFDDVDLSELGLQEEEFVQDWSLFTEN